MRQIQFRAKVNNAPFNSYPDMVGQWVEGYYFEDLCNGRREAFIKSSECTFCVDRETVGQFTGLYDKNGKEIYEGDIVKTKYGKYCEIKWSKVTESMFNKRDKIIDVFEYYGFGSCYNQKMYHLDFPHEKEIIGNIHDNPSLIANNKADERLR